MCLCVHVQVYKCQCVQTGMTVKSSIIIINGACYNKSSQHYLFVRTVYHCIQL